MTKMYGKTPMGGRQEHDYYATDPIAVKLLLNQEKFDSNIWECASGENHIADVLKGYGYNVRTSDIVKRTPTTEVKDFLRTRKKWDGDIITNPPFKYAQEFIDKALSLVGEGHKVAMFLRLQFLEGMARYKNLFKDNPPKTVYVASRRIKCGKDGDFNSSMSSIMCLAWFAWEKGFKGDTVIKWINHDEEIDEDRMRAETHNSINTNNIEINEVEQQEPVVSSYPSDSLLAIIDGLQEVRKETGIAMILKVAWSVSGYMMPQCSARGSPYIALSLARSN